MVRILHLHRIVRRFFFDKLKVFARHIGMKRLASLLAVSAVHAQEGCEKWGNGEMGSMRSCGVASR